MFTLTAIYDAHRWFVINVLSYGDFHAYTRQKKNKAYILKPESGCQGRGIWLTKSSKDIKPQEHMICQVYANKVSVVAIGDILHHFTVVILMCVFYTAIFSISF